MYAFIYLVVGVGLGFNTWTDNRGGGLQIHLLCFDVVIEWQYGKDYLV